MCDIKLKKMIFRVIVLLILTTGIQSELWLTGNPCKYELDPNGPFRQCSCSAVDIENSVIIKCAMQQWTTFPQIAKAFNVDSTSKPSIVALTVTNSALVFINQDAFKGEKIQILDLSHNHIDSINVNAFRGLDKTIYQLSLTGNSLTSIPHWAFTHLEKLQYLHLQENQIVEIKPNTFNETKLQNLHFLYLDKNKIEILSKDSLYNIQLQVLTLANNKLQEIEKQAIPPTIWFLDLKNNLMTQLPYLALKELHKLKTLHLDGNNITTLHSHPEVMFENEIALHLSNNKISELSINAFKSFKKLSKLDLSYNQISLVDEDSFDGIEILQEMDLSYNRIVHIPKNTFSRVAKSLKKLNLEENELHAVPMALKYLVSLEILNINGNKLASLDISIMNNFKSTLQELLLAFNRLTKIPTGLLEGMNNLKHLDLSKNRIQNIEPLSFGKYDGPSKNLIRLNLAGNQIQSIVDPGAFLYMGSLAYLDLSFNRIRQMTRSAFERLDGLESLFLQNNDLTELPISALSSLNKLRYLLLDYNKITNLPHFAFQWQVHIERLSLSHNQIRTISAKTFHSTSATHLKSLNLGHNRITHLQTGAFDNLSNLEQLLLDNNLITGLQQKIFTNLINLRQLTLSGNKINHTMDSVFMNLPRLTHLSLARNKLNRLHNGILQNVPKLHSLDLGHNEFVTFDMTFLEDNQIQLQQIDLSNNKLTRIDVSATRRTLTRLNLSFNNLQFLDGKTLQNFEKFVHINLSNNQLIEIHAHAFKNCPQLTYITLKNNNLRRIWPGSFAHQKLITSLDFSNNYLHELESGVFGKENVIRLYLRKNNFTTIPTPALHSITKSLTYLDLSYNSIRNLDRQSFKELQNITSIVLKGNKIESIEEDTFSEMTKLQYLDLSHNPVTSWSPNAFQKISSSLKVLNLANTGLFSFPKINQRGIQELNVSHNKIYEIQADDIKGFKKLLTLDISYNNLIDIKPDTFESLVELQHLNISGNRLRVFSGDHFKHIYQLESLRMTDMGSLVRMPDAISFRYLRQLKELTIFNLPQVTNYNISKILEVLPPLKSIHFEVKDELFHEQLKNADLRLLRSITITGANLKKIDMGAFERLRGFRIKLTIRDTGIKHFPPFVFNTLSRVSFLFLELVNNKIETLNPFTHTKPPISNQHGTILEGLNLKGNPILCDCRMIWLEQWIEYAAEDANWDEIRENLEETPCSDRAGDTDTLLSVYSQTETKSLKLYCDENGMRSIGASNINTRNLVLTVLIHLIMSYFVFY